MPYKLLHRDITKIKTDAIVNATNTLPICSPGLEMELYQAADYVKMLEARRALGKIECGQAAWTKGFDLRAKYVIHVVTPIWRDGREKELDLLRKCYRNTFKIAMELNCQSIAVPLLMSGVYRFPPRKAMEIALDETRRFLKRYDMTVYLVVVSIDELRLPEKLIARIDEYLGMPEAEKKLSAMKDVKSAAEEKTESFGECLFRLIDERNCTDVEVYKRANVNRRLISRLRINPEKHVDKSTAFALAIGLRLTYEETKEFIALAGWAFSPNYKFDRIVRFFLENGKYDIDEINDVLYVYTGKSLGGS